MSGTRKSLRLAEKKCLKEQDNVTLCKLVPETNLYQRRKTQSKGKDGKFIQKDGIEYNGSDTLISELFDPKMLPMEIKTRSGVENLKRSYVYIISKKIDERTFIKIGVSNTTSTRLGSLQTALIPGLENIGFKLHYLFFYKHESSEKGSTFADNIEQNLHKLLRTHDGYKNIVIHFPTNNPSEWYLPESNKYEEFIGFVLDFISVQTPFPEQAYHFFVQNKKNVREYKTKFLKESTRQEVLQYRKDHIKVKEAILVERKLSAQEKLFKKGSKTYFKERLINTENPVLGDGYAIGDIHYHKGKTDSIKMHGNYYVSIKKTDKGNKTVTKKKRKDILEEMSSYLPLTYSVKTGDTTVYWTHIFNVLRKMKEIGTLEPNRLVTNYNHYFNQPIIEAKRLLNSFANKDVSLRRTQAEWIIGRHVKDAENNVYVATDIKETNDGKVKGVMFSRVNPITMRMEADDEETEANVMVALELAIDFHENKMSKYKIDQKVEREKSDVKYEMYDFIVLEPNYFTDFKTNAPIQKEYIAIVMQNYYKFDKESEEYKHYYDILFEDEMWRLETASVDAKSKKLVNPVQKAKFVAKLKNENKLISNILKELGINTTLTRIKTRSTRKAKPGTKAKPKPGATRRSARLQKGKKNTTMKLRSDRK